MLAVLIFVAFLQNVFTPLPIMFDLMEDEQERIITLDVCHGSDPEFADDDEMPGVSQQQGTLIPILSLGNGPSVSLLFMKFLLTAQFERPPRA